MGIKNNSNNNRRIKVKQYINITETLKRYERALKSISKSSDQAKAIHLKVVAQTALDSETTTADEFNAPHGSSMKESDYIENQAEIVEYDRKLSEVASEAAESVWRGTVLSKNYKSPFDEEE